MTSSGWFSPSSAGIQGLKSDPTDLSYYEQSEILQRYSPNSISLLQNHIHGLENWPSR